MTVAPYRPGDPDHLAEETEHVILVAFSVTAPSRAEAEHLLTMALPRPWGLPREPKVVNGIDYPYAPETPGLESWWVAEDDRRDGSDNDSAVFVKPGTQTRANHLLYGIGLSDIHNVVPEREW